MTSDGIREGLTDIEYLRKGSDASSFARLMDLSIVSAEPGYERAQVTLSDDKHLNFQGRTHGGVIFALADHACGLCGNSLGRKAVLVQSSINLLANPEVGSMIEAEAREGGYAVSCNTRRKASAGWAPEIRYFSSMMKAGTALMPKLRAIACSSLKRRS